MKEVYDHARAFMHQNIKTNDSWLNLTFGAKPSHLCQRATFLDFMVMHIREPKNESTLFRERSNEKKDPGKGLNKSEARFAQGK